MKKVLKKVGYYVVLAILAAIAVVCFKVSWDTMDADSRALCLAGGALLLSLAVMGVLGHLMLFWLLPSIQDFFDRRRRSK